jgi:hemerythrin superfamily protein
LEIVMAEQQRDVIEILTHDHREVEQMFADLESLVGINDQASLQRRKDLLDQATIELVRHSVAEEAEVYPQVKERVSDAEAERAKQEHADAEVTMKRLESLNPGDPTFDQQLSVLMREVREHVAEEEGQMFPHMRTIFTQEELLEMGARVERVKKMAPTRPHPSAPDQPPGDKILGPVTGMFDRMRDALTHRGTGR